MNGNERLYELVMDAIRAYSIGHNLQLQYWRWKKLSDFNQSGRCVCDPAVIVRGNGIFWQESTKVAGLVFLREPAAVLEALRELAK